MAIPLSDIPGTKMRSAFLAAFGKDKFLVRPRFVGQLQVLEFFRAVPVKRRAPDILTGLRIVVDRLECAG